MDSRLSWQDELLSDWMTLLYGFHIDLSFRVELNSIAFLLGHKAVFYSFYWDRFKFKYF